MRADCEGARESVCGRGSRGLEERLKSMDCRAGVEVPEAEMEVCRLRPCSVPAAAMARSTEAWDTLAPPPALAEKGPWAEVAEVGILRPETEEEDRGRREGVGWVGPVIWWVGFGSEMSTGRSDGGTPDDVEDALLATEADCARSAVSSRVSRFT